MVDSNGFEQLNSTIKLSFLPSLNKNVYLKSNINYENSNATYTGLTNWSFENDPKFNPKENAFYYVRVLENPSCRWTAWDALNNGEKPREDFDHIIQDRAWSSPIWYSPISSNEE